MQLASHWAPSGEPCAEDAPGRASALRAGGDVAKPSSSQRAWEWDVCTTITRLGAEAEGAAAATATATATVAATTHHGGCHCGDVRFEVDAPSRLVVWDCNCSDCRMRRNVHFVVPAEKLRVVSEGGVGALAEYRFGTGVARHLFCARCGITPFYRPRSNPDGWAITFHCLDPGTVDDVEVRRFDGQNWEAFIDNSGIKQFSRS